MVSLSLLYELQEIDWRIADRDNELSDVKARLADDLAVTTAKAQMEQLEIRLADRTSARGGEETTVRDLEEKIKAAEERMYGGSVTNPRQFSAYEEEREFHQRQRSEVEDRLLELMVEMEELETALGAARTRYERLHSQREVELVELLESEESLTAELTDSRRSRETVVPDIPIPILTVYDSLLKARNGHAVAKVEKGMCLGCRIAVPALELHSAKTSSAITQCGSCRRILYVV